MSVYRPGIVRTDERGKWPSACVGTCGKVGLCPPIVLRPRGAERTADALSATLTWPVWLICVIRHSTAHLLITERYSNIVLTCHSNEHTLLHFLAARQELKLCGPGSRPKPLKLTCFGSHTGHESTINVSHCTQTDLAMRPTYRLSVATDDSSPFKHHHRRTTTFDRELLNEYCVQIGQHLEKDIRNAKIQKRKGYIKLKYAFSKVV